MWSIDGFLTYSFKAELSQKHAKLSKAISDYIESVRKKLKKIGKVSKKEYYENFLSDIWVNSERVFNVVQWVDLRSFNDYEEVSKLVPSWKNNPYTALASQSQKIRANKDVINEARRYLNFKLIELYQEHFDLIWYVDKLRNKDDVIVPNFLPKPSEIRRWHNMRAV